MSKKYKASVYRTTDQLGRATDEAYPAATFEDDDLAVVEHYVMHARIDNPNSEISVVEVTEMEI